MVHVDPVFGAIPIFLGPICPTSPSSNPLRNLEIHACTVINGSSGCWRETMQVYISGTSSHLFGEMSITVKCLCLYPSLELLPYRQQRAISPAKTMSSREASLENTLSCYREICVTTQLSESYTLFQCQNKCNLMSHPAIA